MWGGRNCDKIKLWAYKFLEFPIIAADTAKRPKD
jgi:hypothetical protein